MIVRDHVSDWCNWHGSDKNHCAKRTKVVIKDKNESNADKVHGEEYYLKAQETSDEPRTETKMIFASYFIFES